MKLKDSLPLKIALMGVLALLMLIPLAMIQGQIRDRERAAEDSRNEVAASWGRKQTLTGPVLKFSYDTEVLDKDKKKTTQKVTKTVFPRTLTYDIDTKTQTLHRSIYDILVYGADVVATGDFVIPASIGAETLTEQLASLGLSDLRGIEGSVDITLGGKSYTFHSGSGSGGGRDFSTSGILEHLASLTEPIDLDKSLMDGKAVLPFRLTYRVKGSSSLVVRPYGGTTEVKMRSDCPDPSFTGDFLPSEREVTDAGFTARWSVSEINRGDPDDTSFGVNFLQGVTQYQQTTRSAKYGILVILLVFIAGLAVELVGKKKIDLVQYLVIGLSLVLFYALVLSFSEFMRFPVAYGLAALMTIAALFGYFRGILRDRSAWLLTALVALAYLLSYILLQMETYALLAGTLVLFVLLVGIMYLTRNLNRTPSV
ncbi:MAG: cell envelope integrity protein CreD, partial [Bacteroidales bacterium]|nr:cell envelope integrity protein CreD [Bacteroidales bacterium]